MDTFVVVKIGARQYKVSKGDTISVDLLEDVKEGKKMKFSEVLLKSDGDTVNIGTPYIKDAAVEAKVLGTKKAKKVTTKIFKAKSRYRRTTGHRTQLTQLEITKI